MSFLMHAVANVPHDLVFDITLPYLFIHYSKPEFRNLDFFIPCRSLHRKLWFKTLNSKIRYHTATLWPFKCMCCLMSLTTLSLTHLAFSFIRLSASFRFQIFSSHVVAYIVSFDSRPWTQKSDILRPRYELLNKCGGTCPSLPSLWHNLTFSFIPLSPSFGIEIFKSHVVACIVSFDSRPWTRESDIIRTGYKPFNACNGSCPSLPCLWQKITLPFHSFLLARVFEFTFLHPMSKPTS